MREYDTIRGKSCRDYDKQFPAGTSTTGDITSYYEIPQGVISTPYAVERLERYARRANGITVLAFIAGLLAGVDLMLFLEVLR